MTDGPSSYSTIYPGETSYLLKSAKIPYGSITGSIALERVTALGETLCRVSYTRPTGATRVIFEGSRTAGKKIYEQARATLRRLEKPLLAGHVIRSPNSKKSLGAAEYARRRSEKGELAALGPERQRQKFSDTELAELENNPLFGMF